MFRRSLRSLAAIPVVAVALGASLLVAPTATAAAGPVTGLAGVPQPPKTVSIEWNAYSGFTVDHYEVTLNPGSRFRQVTASTTSAIFGDLSWSQNYTATVVAVDGGGTKSTPATLDLRGTRLVGSIDPGTARRGSDTTVSGSLKWRSGSAIAGAKIVVMRAYYPPPFRSTKFETVGTVTTTKRGNFSLTTPAIRNAQYRVLYRGEPATEPTVGGWDSNIDLSVTTPIKLRMSPNPASLGSKVRFRGKVNAPGRYVAGENVRLQRRESGQWKNIKSSLIKADSTYSITYQPRTTDDHAWRVVTRRSDFFAPSSSRAKVLVVN